MSAVQLAVYAHPFDVAALEQHGGLDRLAALGYREIALATSYHAGRWLQPWHPDTRVRFLEDGTVHFRPGPDYGALRPLPSSLVDPAQPSPLERLCEAAPRHGLSVRAWTVGTHNTRLGRLHPELCVENAFGDRYSYALCPTQPPVAEYLYGLVEDLGAHDGLGAIEFEAFGWMGFQHSSHHEKKSFTPRGWLDYALSLCFCPACRERLRDGGDDPDAVRAAARDAVQRAITDGDAMAPNDVPEALGAAFAPALRARAATLEGLGRALRQAMPPGLGCAVQVHPEPRFVGSQLALPQANGFRADEHVFTAYGENPQAIERLLAAAPADGRTRRRVCIWPKAPQFTGDDDLVRLRDLAAAHGVTSIAVYHLGLLPWRTVERAARILSA